MAFAQNRLIAPLWRKLRTKVGVRFTRFAGVAVASLATSEIALTLCNGVFHMSSTPAAIVAWFSGAVVSYVLSRWAWERKGKPDVLRETVPFWVISAMVIVILTLATKFGYHSASWMGLHGAKHVLWVDFIYLIANFATFVLRFVIFHYVLFAEPATAARAAATGPDAVPPGTRKAPSPAEAPHTAAVTAEAAGNSSATSGSKAAQSTASAQNTTSAQSTASAKSTSSAKNTGSAKSTGSRKSSAPARRASAPQASSATSPTPAE
jgi:putative flippase GtrA